MNLPQFTLQDLMFSTLLISIGIAMPVATMPTGPPFDPWRNVSFPISLVIASIMIGAGIFALFQKTFLGAVLGFLFLVVLVSIAAFVF